VGWPEAGHLAVPGLIVEQSVLLNNLLHELVQYKGYSLLRIFGDGGARSGHVSPPAGKRAG
jgi:hypothetical protein